MSPPSPTKSHTRPGSLLEDPVDFRRPLTSSQSNGPDPYPQIALPHSFVLSGASPPASLPLLPSHLLPSWGSLLQGEANAVECGKIPFSRPPSPGPFPERAEPLPLYKLQLQAFVTCLDCRARLECKHQIERPWTELDPSDFRYDRHPLDYKHNATYSEVRTSQRKELFKPSDHSNRFRHERSPSPVHRKRIRRIIPLPLCHQAKIPSLKPPPPFPGRNPRISELPWGPKDHDATPALPLDQQSTFQPQVYASLTTDFGSCSSTPIVGGSGSHEDDTLLFDLLTVLRSKEVRIRRPNMGIF